MNNGSLNKELSTLERKIKLMLSEHNKLKEDLEMYRNENNELRSQMSAKQIELSSFQNKYKISKIVDNMTVGGDDASELKEVLNNYIKEIDKCITHLSDA
jgi:chromosome segregation ATPase